MEKHARPFASFSSKKIFIGLLVCIGVLVLASSIGQGFRHVAGHPYVKGFVPTFYLNTEQNVPTYFSALMLAAASGLLYLTAALQQRGGSGFRRHWAFLSLLFLYLSMDEMISIHEQLTRPLRYMLGASGVFYFAWIIPAILLLLVLGVVYLRFLRALPQRTALLFIASGLLYVGGAVGIEMLGGWYVELYGNTSPLHSLIVTVEETMEMLGAALFIYALLDHLRRVPGGVTVRFEGADSPASVEPSVREDRGAIPLRRPVRAGARTA